MGTRRHHVNEGFAGIGVLVQLLQVHFAVHLHIQGGMDTADHGQQMGHEGQPHILFQGKGQVLADFRLMPVPRHRISLEALTGFRHEHGRVGARPAPLTPDLQSATSALRLAFPSSARAEIQA